VTLAAAVARDEVATGPVPPPRAASAVSDSSARPERVALRARNDSRARSRDAVSEVGRETLEALDAPPQRRAPVRAESVGLISPAALERARDELLAPYDGGP
jgi:hypothetical protein